MSDVTKPEFWNERYRKEKTPWDFHGVPDALLNFIKKSKCSKRVLVPGCGSGYEVKAFLESGFDVWAIDFSEAAVASAQNLLKSDGNRIIQADFFSHDFGGKAFDYIYERTFLCALPPKLWQAYAHRMVELLHDVGKLIGYFFYGPEEDPPPYPLSQKIAEELFGSHFSLIRNKVVSDSLPLFKNKECWQEWQKYQISKQSLK